MKKILSILILSSLMFSCRTTKIDKKTGEVVLSANAKHFNRIHPKGMKTMRNNLPPIKVIEND